MLCQLRQEDINRTNFGSVGQTRLYSPAKQARSVPTDLKVQIHL